MPVPDLSSDFIGINLYPEVVEMARVPGTYSCQGLTKKACFLSFYKAVNLSIQE
jgi:hypothetical protein